MREETIIAVMRRHTSMTRVEAKKFIADWEEATKRLRESGKPLNIPIVPKSP